VRGSLSPVWNEAFTFEVSCASAGELFLYFRIYDYDTITSHDFLGHVSMGLMEALVAGKDLSSGWKALLRSSPSVAERIEILRDSRLEARKIPPRKLQAVPGQENRYDLKQSDLVINVMLPDKLEQGPAARQSARGSRDGAFGRAASSTSLMPMSSEVREELNRDVLHAAAHGNRSQRAVCRVLTSAHRVLEGFRRPCQSPCGRLRCLACAARTGRTLGSHVCLRGW